MNNEVGRDYDCGIGGVDCRAQIETRTQRWNDPFSKGVVCLDVISQYEGNWLMAMLVQSANHILERTLDMVKMLRGGENHLPDLLKPVQHCPETAEDMNTVQPS